MQDASVYKILPFVM